MKKFITFLTLIAAFMLPQMLSASVVFDFAGNNTGHALSSGNSTDGSINTVPVSVDGVTITAAAAADAKVYTGELRVYGGKSITIAAEQAMTTIVFEFSQNSLNPLTDNTWTGNATSVTFNNPLTAQAKVKKITVYFAGEDVGEEEPITEVANIAAFKELTTGTKAKLTLTNAQVNKVHVNNNNTNVYIQDATGGLILYNTGLEIQEGTVLNGTIIGGRSAYGGAPQLEKVDKTGDSEITATSLETLAAIEATIAGLNYEANLLKLHTVKNVNITKEGNDYYAVNGENKIQIYDRFNVLTGFEYPEFATINRAILGVFNGTYELFPLTAEDIVTVVKNEGTNLDFENCEATSANVRTYEKDKTGTDVAQMQPVEGWTIVANGDARAGAVFAYGSTQFLGGADFVAPAAGPDGQPGQALGILKVWGETAQYTQDVILPAGKYAITIPVCNSKGGAAIAKNLIGVTIGETAHYATTLNYLAGAWKTEVITFDLEEETAATLSLGYEALNKGNADCPHLFIDEVNIQTFESDEARDEYLASVLPPVAEGVYYLYNEETGKFMSRGSNWATRAAVDEYGLPVQLTLWADNTYALSELDNKLYLAKDGNYVYTDKGTPSFFEVAAVEGAYTLTNCEDGLKMYVDLTSDGYGVSVNEAVYDAALAYWQILTADEYAAIQAEKQTAADAAVAAAAGIPAAALATVEAKGEATTLTFATGSAWTPGAVVSANDKGGNVVTNGNGTEIFQGTKKFTQSVAGLAAGLYKVTIQGFYRGGARENVKALYDQGYNVSLAYLTANATQIRLANWAEDADEKMDPNNMDTAKAAFDAGDYVKSGLVYVGEDGKLDLAVALASYITNGWLMLGNVTYVPVEAKAYNVTVAETENGTVTADKETALVGEEVALTITPDKGYELAELTVKTGETAVELTEDNTFIMPEGDVTVTATFAIKPVVAEGVYYIYNELTGKFMSRGSWWGTRAVLDEYGLPFEVALADGKYTLKELDNNLYYGDDYWMYADCDDGRKIAYIINEVEGSDKDVTLTNPNLNLDVYVNIVDETGDFGVAGNAIAEENCPDVRATYWQFLTAEEYAAIQAEKQAAIEAAVAEAAGVTVADLAAMEETGEPVVLSFKEGETKWTNEATSDRGGGVATGTYGMEVYQGTQRIMQSVDGLEAGLYKVSIQGFYRGGWNEEVAAAYAEGYDFSLSYLDANGTPIRIANWAEVAYVDDEGYKPNNVEQAEAVFNEGGPVKSALVYVGENGKLDLTVHSESFLGGGWLILNNVTYVPVDKEAVPEREVLEQSVDVDYVKGENGKNYTVDFTEALAFLGVDKVEDAKVLGVNVTTGEYVENFLPYDGWRNKDGDFEYWGPNAAVCVKFISEPEKYAIYDMGNDNVPEVGETFVAQYVLQVNEKEVLYSINVHFVAPEIVDATVVKTIELAYSTKANEWFSVENPDLTFDVEEVCEALGIEDINEAKAYIVNVTTGEYVMNVTDGWRDANGDAAYWGTEGGLCLKLNDPASGQFDYIGSYDDTLGEGDHILKWALVADGKAVILQVTVTFYGEGGGTGINGLTIDTNAADIYDLQGRKVQNVVKGQIYIVNGKKVMVK